MKNRHNVVRLGLMDIKRLVREETAKVRRGRSRRLVEAEGGKKYRVSDDVNNAIDEVSEVPTGSANVGEEFAAVLGPVLAEFIRTSTPKIAEQFNAVAPDDMAVPARVEDLGDYVVQATNVILRDQDVELAIRTTVKRLMRSYAGM